MEIFWTIPSNNSCFYTLIVLLCISIQQIMVLGLYKNAFLHPNVIQLNPNKYNDLKCQRFSILLNIL